MEQDEELGMSGEELDMMEEDFDSVDDDDFGFYGEEAEENSVKDIHGITDKVSKYTYTKLEYPCIIFKSGFTCPQHQMNVISNMVRTSSPDKDTALYFENDSKLFKLGKLSGTQVDPLLELIGVENLVGYYDENTRLEGDRLYTLCVL